MAAPACDERTFVELWNINGAAEVTRVTGITEANVYKRRARVEKKLGITLNAPTGNGRRDAQPHHPARIELDLKDGIVLVGSDAHIWPGPLSTGMRAFLKFCKELKPSVVIMNGDVMDFPQISRHAPIGWENHPTVQDEIEAAQDVLSEIEKATFKARKIWTLGNHDARFNSRLASVAPQYAKVHGTRLKDFFPNWEPGWSCFINNDVVIKHRLKGGALATRTNTMTAGLSTVTGHLHAANVRGFTDYRGTRWGVDTGCLANPRHSAFVEYTEDGPLDWRSGFGVLTFSAGKLLQPELVIVHDDKHVDFRGKLHAV